MSDAPSLPEDFGGKVRIFPLPNVVLFPNLVLPLHIFEPRYREMVRDSLAADRLIAMALLREGWESEYGATPAVHPVVCIGRIVQDQELKDGRFNILLHGLRRGRIRRELPQGDELYRTAQVELMADNEAGMAADTRDDWRRLLTQLIRSMLPQSSLPEETPLGSILDLLAAVALKQPRDQQTILEVESVAERLRLLMDLLKGMPLVDRLAYLKPVGDLRNPSAN